jgi:disulfide bond formation protein DsbB
MDRTLRDVWDYLTRTTGSAVDKVSDLQFLGLTLPEAVIVAFLAAVIIWVLFFSWRD